MTTLEYLDYLNPVTELAVCVLMSPSAKQLIQVVVTRRGKRWMQEALAKFGCN